MEELNDGDKEILNLFLHEKPVGTILSLREGEKYASKVSKEVDCTYTHTLKILSELKAYGLVEFEKSGRIKKVKLTDLGEDIAHGFEGLVRRLERLKKEKKTKAKKTEKKTRGKSEK
jgi:predicted transcriptional regulator